MAKSLKAKTRFEKGFACSQSVFSTLAPELGVSEKQALKIGSAFGGGMARHGEVCGAVTGALMALGLKFGSAEPNKDEKIRAVGQEFMRRFEEKNGSLLCKELLGYRLIVPEELEKARKSGVFSKVCPLLVENATETAQEIISHQTP
jgi:C_GCAxxG_C_C family probable redox protein